MQVPGFAPADEALLFRQNDPKPCWPWCGPLGSLVCLFFLPRLVAWEGL